MPGDMVAQLLVMLQSTVVIKKLIKYTWMSKVSWSIETSQKTVNLNLKEVHSLGSTKYANV